MVVGSVGGMKIKKDNYQGACQFSLSIPLDSFQKIRSSFGDLQINFNKKTVQITDPHMRVQNDRISDITQSILSEA